MVAPIIQTGSIIIKTLMFIVILFTLSAVVLIVTEKKDIGSSIYDVGKIFFLSTQALYDNSNELIANNGVISTNTSGLDGVLSILQAYYKLILSIISIIFWLRIIAFFITNSPAGNTSIPFRTWSLAFVFFYFIQVIFILGFEGMNSNIKGLSDVFSIISKPILCYWQFLKSIPILINPLRGLYEAKVN